MNNNESRKSCSPQLRDILLAYLLPSEVTFVPGADGLTLGDALDAYRKGVESGQVPNRAELLRGYPDLAAEINKFFES